MSLFSIHHEPEVEQRGSSMRRVSRRACEDGPLLEEQETEGERQLHGLLLQQLHTRVDVERCVAKRQCFAPAALYRPFGQQAAGVRSLSQFQALQDGEQEQASLRELGLSEAEIQMWRSRDDKTDKAHGLCAAPGAREQRLQLIRDKMDARAELLSRPQRFAASRPLSRREMEIEQALYPGNQRLGFLSGLYHRGDECQQGTSSVSDPMESLYKDLLTDSPHRENADPTDAINQSKCSKNCQVDQVGGAKRLSVQPESTLDAQSRAQTEQKPQTATPPSVDMSRPIGRLRAVERAELEKPLTLKGTIEDVPDEEILKNKETDTAIRSIPRFRNYNPGKPSRVLCVKNLSPQASLAQLVALFSRFEPAGGPALRYRLLTGRLKGQAFITLPDTEVSQNALRLIHGYRLLGKPLVVEFGRERNEEEEQRGR